MSELYQGPGDAANNCTPYWFLQQKHKALIAGACFAYDLYPDGDLHNCHAQCRKCGQRRLVSNQDSQRWCRRCKRLFNKENTAMEFEAASDADVDAYIDSVMTESTSVVTATEAEIDSFVAPYVPQIPDLKDLEERLFNPKYSLLDVHEIVMGEGTHHMRVMAKVLLSVLVGSLIGVALVAAKVKLKWGYLP